MESKCEAECVKMNWCWVKGIIGMIVVCYLCGVSVSQSVGHWENVMWFESECPIWTTKLQDILEMIILGRRIDLITVWGNFGNWDFKTDMTGIEWRFENVWAGYQIRNSSLNCRHDWTGVWRRLRYSWGEPEWRIYLTVWYDLGRRRGRTAPSFVTGGGGGGGGEGLWRQTFRVRLPTNGCAFDFYLFLAGFICLFVNMCVFCCSNKMELKWRFSNQESKKMTCWIKVVTWTKFGEWSMFGSGTVDATEHNNDWNISQEHSRYSRYCRCVSADSASKQTFQGRVCAQPSRLHDAVALISSADWPCSTILLVQSVENNLVHLLRSSVATAV